MVVVMLTDIPNESYVALASRTGLPPEAVERALRAIAPPIARAAQVKVLREKAEEINRRRNGTRIPDVAEAYRVTIATLLATANDRHVVVDLWPERMVRSRGEMSRRDEWKHTPGVS